MTSKTINKFSSEVRARAVRMVLDHEGEHASRWAAVSSIAGYADRLLAAEALVLIYPVWNEGFPAILKGFFDRVFIPGVSFTIGPDGAPVPNLQKLRKLAAVCTYGAN